MFEPPEPPEINRRRLLDLATTAAALVVAGALGFPDRSAAEPAPAPPPPAPAVRLPTTPVHAVHELVPTAPATAIALTVDDGPHPVWTPRVLQTLSRHRVRATFSLVGSLAHARPDLVRRILDEGHTLCNHTMTHPEPFVSLPAQRAHDQIADAQSAITDAGGVAPRLFRAPGGSWSPDVLATVTALQMVPLSWDVDPRDWARPGTAAITRKLLAAKPGDILLCHDGGGNRAQTLAALDTVLPRLTDQGLQFVTL